MRVKICQQELNGRAGCSVLVLDNFLVDIFLNKRRRPSSPSAEVDIGIFGCLSSQGLCDSCRNQLCRTRSLQNGYSESPKKRQAGLDFLAQELGEPLTRDVIHYSAGVTEELTKFHRLSQRDDVGHK